ncbi:MAG: SET domain-containing protein-lysine N-methyltransferase [Alphaproteobacteria bacterium]|nr:SET domain-containing protein-lysine N-methyltransferase [Alphaproteobacteria bacterium]
MIRVVQHPWGQGVVAARALPAGAAVTRFEGSVVPWAQVPEDEVRHVLLVGPDRWMVPGAPARLINHGCDPTCAIDDDDTVRTLRDVAAGEELTIAYNVVDAGEDPGPWDPRWSFDCACGASCCQGRVDGYVRRVPGGWARWVG